MFHSTETTLLSIHKDLILVMDRGEVTSLILLDLSAAFDTVDHSILLHRLQNWFGLHGTSLKWFSSYLTSRSQTVSIQNSNSSFSNLSCGVPQGSVLGPLLFILYTTPLDLSSPRTWPNTTSMLMTPSYTSLSLLQIQLLHWIYFPILSLTYSPGWTQTNYFWTTQHNTSWYVYTFHNIKFGIESNRIEPNRTEPNRTKLNWIQSNWIEFNWIALFMLPLPDNQFATNTQKQLITNIIKV